MKKVTLFTRFGDLVTEVMVPDFLSPPYEAVIWGQRLFIWNAELAQYREGLAYVVPPGQTNGH